MVQVTPVVRPKIVKKKVTKFKRHQSDRFKRLSVRTTRLFAMQELTLQQQQ